MSEALTALIPWYRREGVEVVRGDVDPRNLASVSLLAKHGFVEVERAKRLNAEETGWVDSIYLELRKPAVVSRNTCKYII